MWVVRGGERFCYVYQGVRFEVDVYRLVSSLFQDMMMNITADTFFG